MSVRTTSTVRRRLAAWSLLPVVALTAACGGEDPAADSQDASASESSESGTSDQPYDQDTIIPAMQAALGDAESARIDMDMSGQLEMSIGGQMLMTEEFEEGEMELTVDFQGQTLELRQVDGLLYVSGPPATPPGKWVEIDPKDTENPMAQQFAGLTESGDLNTTFDAFREGLEKVEYVGEEEIDGEATDHYVFTVDGAKAFQAQGQQVPPGAPEELMYDVWLTEDDLMRRVSFELGQVEAVINATDWGEPVEVEAPAQGDLVQAPQM
jgi:hypothetical protein